MRFLMNWNVAHIEHHILPKTLTAFELPEPFLCGV
jgi:hypothetical protein